MRKYHKIVLAAVIALCLAGAVPVLAYFTTYVEGVGQYTVIATCDAKLVEDVVDADKLFKSVHVENLDQSADAYIRVKAICPSDWKVAYDGGTDEDGAALWTVGSDGWMYFRDPVKSGDKTANLDIQVSQADGPVVSVGESGRDFNVIVVYEAMPNDIQGSDWVLGDAGSGLLRSGGGA